MEKEITLKDWESVKPTDRAKCLRVGCPICGELKFDKEGEVIHPEQDRLIYERLENDFKTSYSNPKTK